MTTLHKLSILVLKYIPVIGALFMLIHVVFLLLGINFFIAENLIGLPIIPCIVALIWSKAFGFCKMHRAFIAYISLVTYCINIQADLWGFGLLLTPMRYVIILIGVILFIWFLGNFKKFYYICDNGYKIRNNKDAGTTDN